MDCILEYRSYALPFRAPIRTAHGQWTIREGVVVRAISEDEKVGWGEVAPIESFGTETLAEALAGLAACGGRINERILEQIPSELRCTKGGIREALADLSESTEQVEACAGDSKTHLQIAGLLPAGRAGIPALKGKADAGFRVFKWKVGVNPPAEELPILDDLLAALPAGGKLRLDANGAFDRRRAEAWLTRCADYPIEFFEQPIAPTLRGADDLLLGLAADYPTVLALDESLGGDADIERWLGSGWSGVWVIKPGLFDDAAKACAKLERARARVVFSSALETGIGTRAALRHAIQWRGERLALGFGIWPLFTDRRFDAGEGAPWLHGSQIRQIEPEAIWNALS